MAKRLTGKMRVSGGGLEPMLVGPHAETRDELLPHIIGNIQTAVGFDAFRHASGTGAQAMVGDPRSRARNWKINSGADSNISRRTTKILENNLPVDQPFGACGTRTIPVCTARACRLLAANDCGRRLSSRLFL